MEITLKGNHLFVEEISGCAVYHGACASFDGQAEKVFPK